MSAPAHGGRVDRRAALRTLGTLGAAAAAAMLPEAAAHAAVVARAAGGRLKQSVCRWCYQRIPLEQLARAAREIGLQSVELLGPDEWPVVKQHGLTCAMANGPSGIPVAFNRPSEHDRLVVEGERLLALASAAGIPNMVVFSGNRDGMSDGEGLENTVRGLARLAPAAERARVTLCLELLNSRVDHRDYMADRMAWGAEMVKRVNSPRVRLLYDIYHMQIMEGDVIRTIREHAPIIAHYHTGGVPGRAEIDETQELNYPAIMRAIADTGFTGFVGQEFIPRREPIASLRQGFSICDV